MADNLNQFVEIRKSKKHGDGLFALRDFREGEVVYALNMGRIVHRNEISNLSRQDKDHLDRVGEDRFEIVESPGCYINHSCSPNIKERIEKTKRVGYALGDIKGGEEIVVDYNETAYLEEPFECRCDSENCREIVRGRL